ncbi:hypothetical protein SEVIR_1G177001v4 [Setaria viridis]
MVDGRHRQQPHLRIHAQVPLVRLLAPLLSLLHLRLAKGRAAARPAPRRCLRSALPPAGRYLMHAATADHHAREQPCHAASPLHATVAAASPTAAIGPVPRVPPPAHGRNRLYEAGHLAARRPSTLLNLRPHSAAASTPPRLPTATAGCSFFVPARRRRRARAPPSTAARLREAGPSLLEAFSTRTSRHATPCPAL